MKKRHIIELVFIALIVLAVIMKLFHVAGGSILLTVVALSLSGIYFIGGYFLFNEVSVFSKKPSDKKVSPKRAVYTIALGLSFSIVVVGIQFKLMLWTGADTQLEAGMITLMGAMVFLMAYALIAKKGFTPYRSILKRGAIGIIVGLVMLNISQVDIAKIYYRDNPEYREALINVLENPNDQEAHEALRELQKQE